MKALVSGNLVLCVWRLGSNTIDEWNSGKIWWHFRKARVVTLLAFTTHKSSTHTNSLLIFPLGLDGLHRLGLTVKVVSEVQNKQIGLSALYCWRVTSLGVRDVRHQLSVCTRGLVYRGLWPILLPNHGSPSLDPTSCFPSGDFLGPSQAQDSSVWRWCGGKSRKTQRSGFLFTVQKRTRVVVIRQQKCFKKTARLTLAALPRPRRISNILHEKSLRIFCSGENVISLVFLQY